MQKSRLTGNFWPDVRARIWEKAEEIHKKESYNSKDSLTTPTRKELRRDGYFHRAKCLVLRDVNRLIRPSMISGFVHGIYESLTDLESCIKMLPDGTIISTPEEDYFDDWYDSEDIEKYSQKKRLLRFLNKIARAIHSCEADVSSCTKTDFDIVLSGFVNKVNESKEHLYDIAKIINETYPMLDDFLTLLQSIEESDKREIDAYEKELRIHAPHLLNEISYGDK